MSAQQRWSVNFSWPLALETHDPRAVQTAAGTRVDILQARAHVEPGPLQQPGEPMAHARRQAGRFQAFWAVSLGPIQKPQSSTVALLWMRAVLQLLPHHAWVAGPMDTPQFNSRPGDHSLCFLWDFGMGPAGKSGCF